MRNSATVGQALHSHTHTLTHTTFGRTPLDELSARRRDLYLTTHNTHNRETSMPLEGFEPATPANERPQTHVLDRVTTGTGTKTKLNSMALVRERTIPTERPPPVGEVSANFCHVVSVTVPHGRFNLCFLDRSRYFLFK